VSYGAGEEVSAAEVMIKKEIDSVNLAKNGSEVILNTLDGNHLKLSDVYQIH
jgi:hypothetical protein